MPAESAARAHAAGKGAGNVGVAVETAHFLDDVDLAFAVGPPRRDGHLPKAGTAQVSGEADGSEKLGHHLVAQLGTQHGVDPRRSYRDGALGRQMRRVAQGVDGPSTGTVQQGNETVDRCFGDLGVDAALEAGSGLGEQRQPFTGAGDRRGSEPRGLQEHVAGVRPDLRRGPAHDSSDTDHRVGPVADNAVVGFQGSHRAVQGHEGLAGVCPPGDQAPTRQVVDVVGVVGLAQFQHHVVGRIDHRGDGSHPGQAEASGQPGGRRPRRHPGDHCRGERRAKVGITDFDGRGFDGGVGRDFWSGDGERFSQGGGQVAGHTDDR